MFNNKCWTKIKFCLGILLCSLAIFVTPFAALTSYAEENPTIETRTNIRRWYYKIEDGKMYKRLYNASTGLWESDWIYVCDYPEGV